MNGKIRRFFTILRRVIVVLIAGGTITFVTALVLNPPRMGEDLLEELSIDFPSCSIRVRAYEEVGMFALVPGCYYVFEARHKEQEHWSRVVVFRNDDHVPIPKNQIRAKGKVIFFFIGWIFAISPDGGRTWYVRDMLKELANLGYEEQLNYRLIKDAHISPNGEGVMLLSPVKNAPGMLVTHNYGLKWHVKK